MISRLREKGVHEPSMVSFPNWVDTGLIGPMTEPNPLRRELGIEKDRVVFLYSGNMGEKQGLEILLEAARELEEISDILFVMCGDGAARARLQKLGGGLSNMLWLPLQPLERLNALLNMADVHLLPQRAGTEDLVMPSKLSGMLASGRPIIAMAGAGTQVARAVESAGRLTTPGNLEELLEAITELAQAPETRECLGRNARQYAEEHLSRDTILSNFEGHLIRLAGRQEKKGT